LEDGAKIICMIPQPVLDYLQDLAEQLGVFQTRELKR